MDKLPLEKQVDEANWNLITRRILESRKVSDDDVVTYEAFTHSGSGKEFEISPKHVPLEDVTKYADNSCKHCTYGKGYIVSHMSKVRIKNPQDFIILADQPVKDMTDEQKKLFMEVEKKKGTWKVVLPCRCALKRLKLKNRDIISTQMGNIVIQVDYEIKGENE